MSNVDQIKKEVLALYNSHVSGHVYAITNPAWKGWVKIGMAVDAMDRCSSYNTSSPFRDYKLIYYVDVDDRHAVEKRAHILAATITEHPWNKPDNGEWFKITEEQAIDLIKGVSNEHSMGITVASSSTQSGY